MHQVPEYQHKLNHKIFYWHLIYNYHHIQYNVHQNKLHSEIFQNSNFLYLQWIHLFQLHNLNKNLEFSLIHKVDHIFLDWHLVYSCLYTQHSVHHCKYHSQLLWYNSYYFSKLEVIDLHMLCMIQEFKVQYKLDHNVVNQHWVYNCHHILCNVHHCRWHNLEYAHNSWLNHLHQS